MSWLVSARMRRRFLWIAALAVAAGVAAIVIALLPSSKGGFKGTVESGPVQVVRPERQVPLTARDRREINALLDRFVPAAVARRDPAAAWDLVTSTLHSGTTRAQWATGQIPVSPFDVGGTTFHGWTVVTSYPRDVTLDLTLLPRNPKDGPGAFTVYLKRVRGRWLVDEFYRRTSYAPAGTPTAPSTSTAPAHRQAPEGSKGRLSPIWFLVPLGLLSLIVLVPLIVFGKGWLDDKRVERRHRNELGRQLPPLPRPREHERTPGGKA